MGSFNENSSLFDRLKWVNIIAYFMNFAVTYGIGVLGGWNLPTNAEISEKYQTILTPAGFAFAIWGLIFISQFIWVTLPFLPITTQITSITGCTKAAMQDSSGSGQNNSNASSHNPSNSSNHWIPWVLAIGYEYLWVCLLQIGWTLSFTYELIPISVIMMLLLWAFLGMLVRNLLQSPATTTTASLNLKDYILWFFPFTIHFGWITAASVVNLNVLLVALDTSSKIQFYAAAVSLILLVVLTLLMLEYDYVIPVVVTWALWGIYNELKNPKEAIMEIFDYDQIHFIQMNDAVAIGLILTFVAVKWILSKIRNYSSRTIGEDEAETSILEEQAYLRAPRM